MTYLEQVARCCVGLDAVSFGLADRCVECRREWGGEVPACDEGGFSRSACDLCGRALGGNRYAAHALSDGRLVHLAGCVDCIVYFTNGEPPANRG